MKLRSYYNPTAKIAEVRLQADAAPAAPFVLLGDIIHEADDNASGMQKMAISHVIFQHVQEQLYLQYGEQNMQSVTITNGGTFVMIKRVLVNRDQNRVGIGHSNTISVTFDPVDASHDPVQFMVSNPDLIDIVSNTGNGVLTFRNKGKGELFIKVRTTGYEQDFPYEFDEELDPAIKVASITLAPANVTLTVAAPTQQLNATVLPANATEKGLTYTSSDTAVATVSATGLVTRVANGTAVITATAKDGSGVIATKNVTATA